MSDRRFKLIGQGLPGPRSFDQSDLVDGDVPVWNASTNKWDLVSRPNLFLSSAGRYAYTSGTETVLTLAGQHTYLLLSQPRSYGAPDPRHGKLALAGAYNASEADIVTVAEIDSAEPGAFSLSGMNVQYNGGGGIPSTVIYFWRLS